MAKNTGVVNIRGKEYKTVALRVEEFRRAFPPESGWGIVTDVKQLNADVVMVRAEVVSPDGKAVGVGHAEEKWSASPINKTSAVENCETSAIGRALAACGYAGSEFASANEVERAVSQQDQGQTNRPSKLRNTPKQQPLLPLITNHVAVETELERMGEYTDRIDAHHKAGRLTDDEAKQCRAAVATRTAELASKAAQAAG